MQRSEYIEELEAIRARLLVLGADFAALQLTDENDNEKSRRKCAGKLFEKLNAQLYDNGAVSLRIMQDNANAGIGEQGDLFDEARVESATNEDDGDEGQGEEDHGDDLPPADGVEFPLAEDGDEDFKKKTRRGKKGAK